MSFIYIDYRYLHPEGISSGQLQPPANLAVFYSGSSSNSNQFHTPSPNRLQSEPLSTFGYPAGEMMNNILLQSISSTLENIQMRLKAIEDKHQQTDDAVADLKISLQDIKSNEKKQASSSRKSPPGLSVSIAEIMYFGNEQQGYFFMYRLADKRYMVHLLITTSIVTMKSKLF